MFGLFELVKELHALAYRIFKLKGKYDLGKGFNLVVSNIGSWRQRIDVGYTVSLAVIVNLKVNWRSFTSNLEFLHYNSVLPQSA